jgi:hypothetical protein
MSVIAKFYVAKLERNAYSPDALSVTLQPVTRGDDNKTWASATPNGKIEMVINNKAAADQFGDRLGQEFLITFEPVPTAQN